MEPLQNELAASKNLSLPLDIPSDYGKFWSLKNVDGGSGNIASVDKNYTSCNQGGGPSMVSDCFSALAKMTKNGAINSDFEYVPYISLDGSYIGAEALSLVRILPSSFIPKADYKSTNQVSGNCSIKVIYDVDWWPDYCERSITYLEVIAAAQTVIAAAQTVIAAAQTVIDCCTNKDGVLSGTQNIRNGLYACGSHLEISPVG
ncbi:hypothetical protein LTR84_004332 [Exophiala bonariae]|uniref:Uncharacterized protein n=1 Tax=Exophiala bonariae TaxID=1690606 RepID=A0AAV9N5L5_9EURO|nr:hypothetical protein LTR84_004332 [Exophiala bonariae]